MITIQITGDLTWAEDKVSDLKSLCLYDVTNIQSNITGVDNSTNSTDVMNEEVLIQMEIITSVLCPGDCSGNGTCNSGICDCSDGESSCMLGFFTCC